jgi:hypothetical protein
MGDKMYGVYEVDDDYWDKRVVRDIPMDMKGANIGQ